MCGTSGAGRREKTEGLKGQQTLQFERLVIAASAAATGSYAYDGNLRRVKQVVNGVTRYSVYDVSGRLVEIDTLGDVSRDYIQVAGMTVARVSASGIGWQHPDHLGSSVAATLSTGLIGWRESEQPFGEDWISAPANDNQPGYTGHIEDAATGLVYMQARYYDPVIGRFLAPDPVGFTPMRPDMFSRYAYAGNDPVNATDPTGENPLAIIPVVRTIRLARAVTGSTSGAQAPFLGSPAAQYHYTVVGGASCACVPFALSDLTASANDRFDDRIFDIIKVKPGGKIAGDVDTDTVPDDLLGEGIEVIEQSVKTRTEEQKKFPRGNPNGDGRERKANRDYLGHEQRIEREKKWLEQLRERQRKLPRSPKEPSVD